MPHPKEKINRGLITKHMTTYQAQRTTNTTEKIVNLILEMTQDWDLDFDEEISPQEQLIADLNFSSVDFVQLFVSIEEAWGQKFGFHNLIMPNGKYVDDLSIAQLVDFVDSKFNAQTIKPVAANPTPVTTPPLSAAQVAQFRQLIRSPQLPLEPDTAKNQQMVFILCPSRSGSTLLRVMLAGHPQLFAPPELHLLTYHDLAQRKASLGNPLNEHLLNGTIRAIMQIKSCDAPQAKEIMAECEQHSMTTKQFYNFLQQGLGERILIDKTPSYTYHVDILNRIEQDFDAPLYIHLIRHPYGTIRSFEDAKLDQLLPFMRSDAFTRREYAELAWLTCQQNILELKQNVPQQRWLQIQFEDLVTQPQATAVNICQFLNLEFQQQMLAPYQEKQQRMTDSVELVSKMSGDLKFHLHQDINPEAAHRWQQYHTSDFLSEMSKEVAISLGYSV